MKFFRLALVLFLIYPIPIFANETTTTTSTTTTTTTIPEGEVEEIETFDGTTTTTTTILEEVTETTTTTTTTTTVPETWEQSTDMIIPEDEIDIQGNEIQNNIDINNTWSGQYGCTDYCINLEFRQHGGEGADYEFDLPETTTINEEEYNIDIYEVGFTIGALNNESTVTYTHTDETTEINTIEAQTFTSAESMYEIIVYNIRETLDTFIDKFTLSLNDWTLVDDISFKYTTTTTTTTTTTLPPPAPEPEPEPMPKPEPEIIEVVLEDGSVVEYEQHEIDDGTVERDNERKRNEELYGCYLTDAAMERGDCKVIEEVISEEVIIIEDELYEETARRDSEEELFQNDDLVFEVVDEYEDEIFVELTEEQTEKYIETVKEVEEYLETLEEFEIEVIDELEEIKIEDIEIIFEEIEEEEIEDEVFTEVLQIEDITEENEEIFVEEVVNEQIKSLTEEEIKEEVNELVEVIEIELEEDLTDDEVAEEIEEYVDELETEEVIEVLEEVNDIGVQELANVTEEVQEVIQAVVEEAIENVNDLNKDQVKVVAEVLQVATDDVEIIAETIKTDEVVAEAVEEYVERAVKNADVENYTLADVTTEINFEAFTANPIEVLVDFDNITEITFTSISNDMTTDQKEKAQEVVVPVILARIAAVGSFIMRKTF